MGGGAGVKARSRELGRKERRRLRGLERHEFSYVSNRKLLSVETV